MSAEGPATQERRVVTALFCDVVGSIGHAESMDPEDWTDVVNRTVTVMAACVGRFGGTVTMFGGDAIMAVFGTPTAHEDDPYHAVRAGLDIIDEVAGLSRELQRDLGCDVEVRVGINTGLAVTGEVVDGLDAFSALGDTTNVASRLQSLADPGAVVVSEATYAHVSADVEARELSPQQVKGKKEAVLVYEVSSISDAPEERRGVPGFASPMVGRDSELAALRSSSRPTPQPGDHPRSWVSRASARAACSQSSASTSRRCQTHASCSSAAPPTSRTSRTTSSPRCSGPSRDSVLRQPRGTQSASSQGPSSPT